MSESEYTVTHIKAGQGRTNHHVPYTGAKTKSDSVRPRPVRGGHPRTTYAQATDPRSTVTVHGPTPPAVGQTRAPPSPPARAVGALTKSYSRLQRAGAATIQFPNIAVTVGLGPYKHEK